MSPVPSMPLVEAGLRQMKAARLAATEWTAIHVLLYYVDATEIEEGDASAEMQIAERRAAALRHWERCFLDGTVDDQHAEFIAGILAKAREEIE
jgi:hypothetical protein